MDATGHSRIAVVDDAESLCRSLGRLLRLQGFEPTTYPSAEAYLESDPAPCDCLVLDVHLAAMSGLELNEHLAAKGSRVPVIFLTADDDPNVRERALASGCAGFFQKTEPGERVTHSIRKAVRSNHPTIEQPK